jgi:hypothetical protein
VLLNCAYVSAAPPSFSGARAFQDLTRYVELGHRYYGAPQREVVIKTLREALSATLGGQAPVLTALDRFKEREQGSGETYELTNIIARLHPERPLRVLLGTHWDTRLWAEEDPSPEAQNQPITGANDGTSGLAVLLELSRLAQRAPLEHIGVDVVFFDGEEFGRPKSDAYCKGSRRFAAQLSRWYPNPQRLLAVFVLDMVGDADLSLPPERSSATRARSLTQLVWSVARSHGAEAFVSDKLGPWIIDDHTPFQELNIPSLLLIDYDYPHWHTQRDTLDKCSPQSLEQVGRVMWSTLKQLDDQLKPAQTTPVTP